MAKYKVRMTNPLVRLGGSRAKLKSVGRLRKDEVQRLKEWSFNGLGSTFELRTSPTLHCSLRLGNHRCSSSWRADRAVAPWSPPERADSKPSVEPTRDSIRLWA